VAVVDLLAMGVATALNFQPAGEGQAAITGDFVLVAAEVNPVAQTLRKAGIDVMALHNHHKVARHRNRPGHCAWARFSRRGAAPYYIPC